MIIKVCGMTDSENIRAIESLDIDLMGFIFYDKSKRKVPRDLNYMPSKCSRVGVFVNSPLKDILDIHSTWQLDFVQLHGDETPCLCNTLSNEGLRIIKAFHISDRESLETIEEYEGCIEMALLDTKCKEYGGSGKKFDWELLQFYNANLSFLLSGGITNESIVDIKSLKHPKFAGIDINSGFELGPGLKDINKVSEFIKSIRS